MPLTEYIAARFGGNQSEFARHVGVNRQQVTRWINEGFIVVDGILYSPRRNIT
nr:helix-turn-helix domain-containing protein [Pantoea sp. CCBC3-3-1]